MSRSEFFARAASRYLDELDAESVTCQIDTAIDSCTQRDDSGAEAVAVGHRVLGKSDHGW